MHSRLHLAQKKVCSNQGVGYLISNPTHIAYLTDFQTLVPEEREAFLIYTGTKALFLHAHFSTPPKIQGLDTQKEYLQTHTNAALQYWLVKNQVKTLFFDAQNLSVHEWQTITKQCKPETQLESYKQHPIAEMLLYKDSQEIEVIRESCRINRKVLRSTIANLQEGMTERKVLQYIQKTYQKEGITSLAFPPIVAFGLHAANPHHQPTESKLMKEQLVLIDIGAVWNSYCSDITRTIWFGKKPTKQFQEIESIVKTAYALALEKAKSHATQIVLSREIDLAARSHITDAGFGKNFIHTTGHGIGRVVHEQPSISSSSTMRLQKNMVITIEPGIYLEGEMGYRHENTVLLEEIGVTEL